MRKQSWFLSDSHSPSRQKRIKWLYRLIETYGVPNYAEEGTRTPTPLRAQRPERCVSTSFTTSADVCCPPCRWTGTILLYLLPLVKRVLALF
jgi:hypothetical protein